MLPLLSVSQCRDFGMSPKTWFSLWAHGDLLTEIWDHLNPKALCSWGGRDGITHNFQRGIQWLSCPPNEMVRGSIRHCDPDWSKPMDGHWTGVKEWQRGSTNFMKVTWLFPSFVIFDRLRWPWLRTWFLYFFTSLMAFSEWSVRAKPR